jgi:hypothetical protein
MRLGTHADRLDRFLGPAVTAHLSRAMVDWYGPPLPVAGVPGTVWAHPGGDFRGTAREGGYLHALDFAVAALKRRWQTATHAERQARIVGAGFASLSDLISEATTGKKYDWAFTKVGSTGVVGVTNSLWRAGNMPPAGSAPAAAPGGTAFTSASTGGFPYPNPAGGDTLHFVWGTCLANFVNTLLLYDLLFGVSKTMASAATEAVTGVPTRYQSTTSSAMDYIGGNFLFVQVGGTALAATAHNWTVCTYRDQADAASTLPSLVGNASAIVDRLDHPTQQWYAPLETGDSGVKALTQMQASASVATGVIWFMIGHPIALLPIPLVNIACQVDGINTAFNLARIFDNACLAFLELTKPATNATTYNGGFAAVAG